VHCRSRRLCTRPRLPLQPLRSQRCLSPSRVHRIRVQRPFSLRDEGSRRTCIPRLHSPRKASPFHRDGAMGLRTCVLGSADPGRQGRFRTVVPDPLRAPRLFHADVIRILQYTNDSTLRNVHWALCTGVFGKRDVGRIEREFLQVLNWDLSISEDDILSHHHSIYSLHPNSVAESPDSSLVATSSPRHSRSADMEEKEISSWSDSDDDSCSSDSSLSPITPPLNLSGHESYSRQTASSSVTPSRPCRPVMDLGLDILDSFPIPNQRCSPVPLVDGKGCRYQNPIPQSTRVWV